MKYLHLALAAAVLLFASSCTKKEEIKSVTTSTRTLVALATATDQAGASTSIANVTAMFQIDNVKKLMDFTVSASSSASGTMPFSKIKLTNIATSYPASNVIEFSADGVTPVDDSGKALSGYSVSNFKGVVDESRNIAHITFRLRTPSGTQQIVLTTQKIMSALPDNSVDYSSATTAYCEFRLNVRKTDSITATLYMHNVKFADKMPTQTKIGIPGIKVSLQANGFKLEADSITPNSYDGQDNATPMDSRKVSDFKGNLDLVNGNYSVEFKCFGVNYNSAQDLNGLLTTLRIKK